MPLSNFGQVRKTVRFADLPIGGDVYFVHSGTGSATGGHHPDAPAATIDQAINLCTANNGDVIYVLPGHAETLSAAAAIACDVAGISIIGLGNGTNRPTITLDNTAADVNVSAADVHLENLRFVSDVDSLVNFLDLDEGRFSCHRCWFETSAAKEAVVFVDIATTKDFFEFHDCVFLQPSDPAGTDGNAGTGGIYVVDSEHVLIKGCRFIGNFETGIIHNKTTAAKNLYLVDCLLRQELSTGVLLELVDGATGGIDRCLGVTPNAADVTEAAIIGAIGDSFFVGVNSGFGNDGAGGQLAVAGAAAAT